MHRKLVDTLKRGGLSWRKLTQWHEPLPDDKPAASKPAQATSVKPSTDSSLARILGHQEAIIDEYYFPAEVIGGVCPRVVGEEETIIWNAAAEACDSERVHVVWQVLDDRIWYLAARSSELASHPNSWCPFAAFLPGMKEAPPAPACYTYYGEEIATMMTVKADELHIYRGTNQIVRAKAERTAREMGNAPIIDLVPEKIAAYAPVPWYSVSLFEERARRLLASAAIILSLALTGLGFMVWLLAGVGLISARSNLQEAQTRSRDKTQQLLILAQNLRSSPMRDDLSKFLQLNEGLLDINGYLELYAIKGGRARWRAAVPSNVTADRINALGGKTIDASATGTVIGNAAQIDYEAARGNKK